MSAFFASGHVVDLILLVIAAEAVWLAVRRRTSLIAALIPGVLILLALRAALTGAAWPWIAMWLTLSLPAHLWDMRRRLQRL